MVEINSDLNIAIDLQGMAGFGQVLVHQVDKYWHFR